MNLSELLMPRNNDGDYINAEYVSEISEYAKSPTSPCTKERSIKLLRKFARKEFSDFWCSPVNDYLPAVSEGTMKLTDTIFSHDDAVTYAKKLICGLDPKELAKAFLYGTAKNAPEYRTALACYYYIKHLPIHGFEKKHICTTFEGDFYSDSICEICNYNSKPYDEPKIQFWSVNNDMYHFYLSASIPHCFTLNTAIVYLEEYKKLPVPNCTKADLDLFNQIISLIEVLPEDTYPSKLRKELKNSGIVKMTLEQLSSFIDMLGYLNILHTNDSFGVTVGHTKERDMIQPTNSRNDFAYPVNLWTRKCGIDYDMLNLLFGDLY